MITNRDLLQSNSAVVAGILIMLTLLQNIPPTGSNLFDFMTRIIIAAGILPFIISNIILLRDRKSDEQKLKSAKRVSCGGYGYAAVAVMFILIIIPPK